MVLPDDEFLPTGASLIDDYLAPLAALPVIARHLTLDATVEAVTRAGLDRVSGGDAAAPRVAAVHDPLARCHRHPSHRSGAGGDRCHRLLGQSGPRRGRRPAGSG
ncbi:hypothetical protein ACFQ4K_18435 [Tistrella bauzanensis]